MERRLWKRCSRRSRSLVRWGNKQNRPHQNLGETYFALCNVDCNSRDECTLSHFQVAILVATIESAAPTVLSEGCYPHCRFRKDFLNVSPIARAGRGRPARPSPSQMID